MTPIPVVQHDRTVKPMVEVTGVRKWFARRGDSLGFPALDGINLTANPGAMTSPVHHRSSFHNLLGDCCSVDNLHQPFPLLADRLMHPPSRLPAI